MDPISQNIRGVQQLVGSKLNKTDEGASNELEGVKSEKIDVLSLELDDQELLALSKKWTAKYAGYEAALKKRQEANLTYYLGKQKEGGAEATDGKPISANLLFEAEETFLPQALKKNPDPVVFSDNTNEGDTLSNSVKTMLQYHSDVLVLRRKLSRVVRHWSIYFVGIVKHGWDNKIQEIDLAVRNPKNFILDPEGFVDEYADYIGYLGERITVTAEKLIKLFPKHKEYITIMTNGKLGSDVIYTEWWTDEFCFYTFKEKVLDKNKNPHYNYAKKEVDPMTGMEQEIKGRNHFAFAKKPYTFLSIFSLGEQPHDITNLIEQNIPNQRRVSRRTDQIDFNLSRQNNSTAFSEDNFTQEEAKQASTAMAKGHPILVPPGRPIQEAIHKIDMTPVPPAFFNALENDKNDLRSIFGTEGLSAQPVDKGELATNLVQNERHDATRIGGGIGDALEQFCDNIFNWWVQLYFVYYDEAHYASILGKMRSVEYVQLSSQTLDRKIVVSVAPDSMRPHDEITEMNQAMALFQAGVLDPKSLFTRINFPDAEKTAEQSVLWMVDKQTYMQLNFPEIAQQIQQQQQQMQAQQIQAQQGQMEQASQMAQQEAALKQQGAQQQNEIQGAQAGQALTQKQQEHEQKLRHQEEAHQAKLKAANQSK